MTSHQVTLRCDGPGCTNLIVAAAGTSAHAALYNLIADANRAGWISRWEGPENREQMHLCPACAKNGVAA